MSVSVSMPQLGESVTEGTVTRWLKKEGERVEVDEPLLEVSTDKVDTEIPSPASGILRGIAVDEDETVAVGAQLAVIEDSESGDAAPAADDSASAEAAEHLPARGVPARGIPARGLPARGLSLRLPAEASQPEQAPAASSDGWSSQPNYAPPAIPPAGLAGVLRLVRAFDARLRSPARVRPAPAGCPLRPAGLIGSRLQPASAVGSRRPAPPASRPLGSSARPARPRLRSTRRPRRCRAAATRPTSPRWSASSPPSMP